MTRSDFIKAELERMDARSTLNQIAARLSALEPVEPREAVVDMLREARDAR